MMLWRALIAVGVVGAVQHWEEEPGYREVNPGGAVVMNCRVKNKLGECKKMSLDMVKLLEKAVIPQPHRWQTIFVHYSEKEVKPFLHLC